METINAKLTILFDEPFWIGIYERKMGGHLEVCKITFGAEPKDYEVYDFMLRGFTKLRFSPCIKSDKSEEKHINPKRMQRVVHRLVQDRGIGTKAQQALKLQQEQGKLKRKEISREQREAAKERQFLLHQEKKRAKHRGH